MEPIIQTTRLAHYTDIHLPPVGRIPESRSPDYPKHLKFKLDSLNELLRQGDYDGSVISGDFFHLKKQSYYSPSHLNTYRDYFNSMPGEIYAIAGNHDLPGSSIERINESAYANLIGGSKIQHILKGFKVMVKPFVLPNGNTINHYIIIAGVSYLELERTKEAMVELNEAVAKFEAENKGIHTKLIMLHTDAMPAGDETPVHWAVMTFDAMLDLCSNFDIVCQGHIHFGYPVYSRMSGITGKLQYVSKPFSMGRVVRPYLADENILEKIHKPSICDIQIKLKYTEEGGKPSLTKDISLEYVVVPHVPAEEAFVKEELQRQIKRSQAVLTFTAALNQRYGSKENAFSVSDPEDMLKALNLPKEVMDEVEGYLE